jgi:hypothetical protein
MSTSTRTKPRLCRCQDRSGEKTTHAILADLPAGVIVLESDCDRAVRRSTIFAPATVEPGTLVHTSRRSGCKQAA